MSIWISILLITICALMWDIGVVLQKQAADCLPRIAFGRELPGTILACLKHWKWTGGLIASAAGWGVFAYALNFTPVSLARTIQGSGFVILAFFSILFLNHRLKPWEWVGVFVITAGVAALGFSDPPAAQTQPAIMPLRLALLAGGFITFLLLLYSLKKIFHFGFQWTIIFAMSAGITLGMGDVSTKTLLTAAGKHQYILAFGMVGPFLIGTYLTGQMLLTRSYQHGRAILVTAISDFCSRVLAIIFGVVALGEAFPTSPLLKGLRIGGLAAIILGAALMTRFSGEQLAEELEVGRK